MPIDATSGARPAPPPSAPEPSDKNVSLLARAIRFIRAADSYGAGAVCLASQVTGSFGEDTRQVFRAASDDLTGQLSRHLPSLPVLTGQVADTLAWLAGAAPPDSASSVIDIPEATLLLQAPEAQDLLARLLLPENAPGGEFCRRLAELAGQLCKTTGAVTRACLKALPQHLRMNEMVLSELMDIIRPALKTVPVGENAEIFPVSDDALNLTCRVFLAGQVPGTTCLPDLLPVLLANQLSARTDVLSPLVAGSTPEQCLAGAATELPSPPAGESMAGSGAENTGRPGATVTPESSFIPSGDTAVGLPDGDFRIYAYDTLSGYQTSIPLIGPDADMVLVQAGTSMSFGRMMKTDETMVCGLPAGQGNATSVGEFPGGATVTTHAGPGSSGRMVIEKQVTTGSEPLLFAWLRPAAGGSIQVRENLLQPGDGIVRTAQPLPGGQKNHESPGRAGADHVPALSGKNTPAAESGNGSRPPVSGPGGGVLSSLSSMAGQAAGVADSMVNFFMAPGLWHGALGNPAGNVTSDKQRVWEEIRNTRLAQSPGRASTIPPPATAPAPWTLQQQANGTLTFSHHAAVHLEDYALSSEMKSVLNTPLSGNQTEGRYNIRVPGSAGSRVYQVSLQPFAVSRELPMAMTDAAGASPLEITTGQSGNITVATNTPLLHAFLGHHYQLRGPFSGYTTTGGDGLIRNNAGDILAETAFGTCAVRPAPEGKYTAQLPAGSPLRAGLPPLMFERQGGKWLMRPAEAHGQAFLDSLAKTGRYGISGNTTGVSTSGAFRRGGYVFPYSRHVLLTWSVGLPAVTDPAGHLPPVPLTWRNQAAALPGENGLPGQYYVHSSAPDPALRPSLTLRQEVGVMLMAATLFIKAPYLSTWGTIRAARGDTDYQERLWQSVLRGEWPEDNRAGPVVAKAADIYLSAISLLSVESMLFEKPMEYYVQAVGKMMAGQPTGTEVVEDVLGFLNNIQKLINGPLPDRTPEEAEAARNFQRLAEKVAITERLESTPEHGLDNVFAHRDTGGLWIMPEEGRGSPVRVMQEGDLYVHRAGGGETFYCRDSGKLRPLTPTEAVLNREPVPVTGEDVPQNLYRDPRTGWQYVRDTDARGIRIADRAVALHDTGTASAGYKLYEVPGSGELFREENGRLRPLTASEARERAAQLPSEATLNAGNYEKVYVINRDGARTVEYAPKADRSSPLQQNGRSTYRYEAGPPPLWRQTGKTIDADGRVLSMPGGGIIRPVPDSSPEYLNLVQPAGQDFSNSLSLFLPAEQGTIRTEQSSPGLYKVDKNLAADRSVQYYQLYYGNDFLGRRIVLDHLERTSEGFRTVRVAFPEGLSQPEMATLKRSLPNIRVSYDEVTGVWNQFVAKEEAFMDVQHSEFTTQGSEISPLLDEQGNTLHGLYSDPQGRGRDGRRLVWAEAGELNGQKVGIELEQDGAENTKFWQKTENGYRKFVYSEYLSGLVRQTEGATSPVNIQSLLPTLYEDLPVDGFPENTLTHYVDGNGYQHNVAYDGVLKTWRETGFIKGELYDPVWWNGESFETGTIDEFKKAKRAGRVPDPVQTTRVRTMGNLPVLPHNSEMFDVPKRINYVWVRNDIPEELLDNLVSNAERSTGYKSILHLDLPENIYNSIKNRLKSKKSNIQISHIRCEPFFNEFKETATGRMYEKAVNGDNPNCALASDVVRYHYDGIYLDADDKIINASPLKAAKGDVLLSQVHLRDHPGSYGNSNFATLPDNPIMLEMISEIERNAEQQKFKNMVDNPRPYMDGDGNVYIWENGVKKIVDKKKFDEYRNLLMEFAGPVLMSKVVKRMRPDYFDAHIVSESYPSSVVQIKAVAQEYKDALNHYFPFQEKFKVQTTLGTASWRKT